MFQPDKTIDAAAHLIESTNGRMPNTESWVKDRALLSHAKRYVRISKELRRFGEAENLSQDATEQLIADTLRMAGASDEFVSALVTKSAPNLAATEERVDEALEAIIDGRIEEYLEKNNLPASDVELISLLESRVEETVETKLASGVSSVKVGGFTMRETKGGGVGLIWTGR